jgi:hypothetical protein
MDNMVDATEIPIAFFDQLGRLQMQVTLPVDELTGSVDGEVSLDNLASGVYVLKFGNSGFVRKLIVTDR